MQDILSVALRALSFLFLLQAAGVALFVAILGRHLSSSADAIRRLGRWSALVGLALVAAHYALEAARMAGDFSGIWDLSLQGASLRSGGAAFGVRVLGLFLLALSLRRVDAGALVLGVVGAAITVAAFTLVGHTAVHPQRWLLAPLLMLHLLIVAFWLGALLPLYLASRRETPETSATLVNAFSRIASWLVPGILVAGVALAILLVPNIGVFAQPYGWLLLTKVALFAALMGLASLNKWRLGPALARGDHRDGFAFRWSLCAEYALIFVVLAVTAVMTTFFSPE